MLSGAWIIYIIAVSPVYIKIAMALSVGNYILFFWREAFNSMRRNYKQKSRQKMYAASFETGIKAKIDFKNSVIIAGDSKYSISPVGTAAQELVVVGGLENWVKEQIS